MVAIAWCAVSLSSTCPLSKNNLGVIFPWPPLPLAIHQTQNKMDFNSFHFLPTVFTSSCPVLLSRLLICLSVSSDEDNDDYGDDDGGLIVWVWMAVQKFTSARNVPLFYSSTSKLIYISSSHSSKATWNLHELFPQGCVCVVTQWQGSGVQASWPLGFIILSTKLLFLSLDHRILLKLLSHLGI